MLQGTGPKPVHVTTERSLVWIFQLLAKARRTSDSAATIRIPETVFYQHGSLRAWFTNDLATGEVVRRDKRDCTNERIIELLGAAPPPGAVSDGIAQKSATEVRRWRRAAEGDGAPLPKAHPGMPVAQYSVYESYTAPQAPASSSAVSGSTPGGGGSSQSRAVSRAPREATTFTDESGDPLDELTQHYMDRDGLYLFLENSRAARHNAVLQRFPHGQNPHHSTVSVVWSPHQCVCSQRQNLYLMTDQTVPVFNRCCTAESFSHLSREMKMTPNAVNAVAQECAAVVRHIAAVESRHVLRLSAVFAIDDVRRPVLLYCTEVQLTSAAMPMTDVKAGLARTFSRRLVNLVPPVRNGAAAIVAAGGGLSLDEVQGAAKGRSGSRIKLKYTANRDLGECIEQTKSADPFTREYDTMGNGGADRARSATPAASAQRRRLMMRPRFQLEYGAPNESVADSATPARRAASTSIQSIPRHGGGTDGSRRSTSRAGSSSLVSPPKQQEHPMLTEDRARTTTPYVEAKERDLGVRYSAGGGGGFYIDHGVRREAIREIAAERRARREEEAALRAGNRTPENLAATNDEDDEDDVAMSLPMPASAEHGEARKDIERLYMSTTRGSAGGAQTAGPVRPHEARDRAWRRVRRRFPAAAVAVVEQLQRTFQSAAVALEDLAAAIDTVAAVLPRDVPHAVVTPVALPETFLRMVEATDTKADALVAVMILSIACGIQVSDVPHWARDLTAHEDDTEIADEAANAAERCGDINSSPSSEDRDNAVDLADTHAVADPGEGDEVGAPVTRTKPPALSVHANDDQTLALRAAATRVGLRAAGEPCSTRDTVFDLLPDGQQGGSQRAKVVLSFAGAVTGTQLEAWVRRLVERACPLRQLRIVGGWHAMRERLTNVRAALGSIKGAELYSVVQAISRQRVDMLSSVAAGGSFGSISVDTSATGDHVLSDLIAAEVAVAGPRAEWPPRWSIEAMGL